MLYQPYDDDDKEKKHVNATIAELSSKLSLGNVVDNPASFIYSLHAAEDMQDENHLLRKRKQKHQVDSSLGISSS